MIPTKKSTIVEDGIKPIIRGRYQLDADSVDAIQESLQDLYSNPLRAVVREYLSNAIDAHRRIGQKCPIDISLPGAFDDELVIRDFGGGIPEHEVGKKLFSFGASDKRETNNEIGTRGMGCKSGYALSDVFTITVWNNGKEQVWLCGKDSNGRAVPDLISFEDSDEPSGLRLSIPVEQKLHHEAAKEVEFYTGWARDVQFNIMGGSKPGGNKVCKPLTEAVMIGENKDIRAGIYKHQSVAYDPLVVVAGGIPTIVSSSTLKNLYKIKFGNDSVKKFSNRTLPYGSLMVLEMPIGSFNLTPSRDNVKEDSFTAESIVAAHGAALYAISEKVADKLSSYNPSSAKEGEEEIKSLLTETSVLPNGFSRNYGLSKAKEGILCRYIDKFGTSLEGVHTAVASLDPRASSRRRRKKYSWSGAARGLSDMCMDASSASYVSYLTGIGLRDSGKGTLAMLPSEVSAILVLDPSDMDRKVMGRKRIRELMESYTNHGEDEATFVVISDAKDPESGTALESAEKLSQGVIPVVDATGWYKGLPKKRLKTVYSPDGCTIKTTSVSARKAEEMAKDCFLYDSKDVVDNPYMKQLLRVLSAKSPIGIRAVYVTGGCAEECIAFKDQPSLMCAQGALIERLRKWYGNDSELEKIAVFAMRDHTDVGALIRQYERDEFSGRPCKEWNRLVATYNSIRDAVSSDKGEQALEILIAMRDALGSYDLMRLAAKRNKEMIECVRAVETLNYMNPDMLRSMPEKYRVKLLYRKVKDEK